LVPKRIPTHRPHAARVPTLDRNPDAQSRVAFYSARDWKRTRAVKLAASPLCEVCLAADRVTPASHVHHLAELADRPELAYTLSNLQSVCLVCHTRIHATR
jgi:5-methylcytosine-specific restriction enzyme A